MVSAEFHPNFKKIFLRIKDTSLKEKIIKQFKKIRENPEIGKPMRYARKSIRELYVNPLRLSYSYIKEEDAVVFIDLYHKDEQ